MSDGPHSPPRPALRRRSVVAGAALLAGLAPLQALPAAKPLEPDEEALFMTGTARPTADGRLEVDVHAWIFEREHRWGLNAAFARYLGLSLKKLSPAARLRFNQRTALFHAESEEGKLIDIAFDGVPTRIAMPPSGKDGRSNLRVVIDAPRTSALQEWQQFHGVTGPGELLHRFKGQSLIVPAQGVSIISDIDDTIKHTQVRDRREMLLNTFARRFEATPGMAAYYRALAKTPDTRFHYLSASPIQLYPALSDFIRGADFPEGSMHLRESTTWRTLIPGDEDSRAHKLGVIERLFTEFPQRRFVLVGDSGEADPEIYAQVMRAHAGRIDGIVIRDVTGEGRLSDRYRATFDGIDPVLWHILMPDTTAWPIQTRN
ncbi:phosphatidate phosphatase App1 family protein [Variovorax sp. PAMC26660]|uniref:phosphatidate phosphatase App1 family protein n=1 Tax=Variovorax sp. PAMC26660 TaxID=2762322 RepID=UPI00164DE689|nr:App1 family protein [Variovorax sp. PAMC26660]QNK65915.1 App1 family protein [Variovorax sp. PAMC26660]